MLHVITNKCLLTSNVYIYICVVFITLSKSRIVTSSVASLSCHFYSFIISTSGNSHMLLSNAISHDPAELITISICGVSHVLFLMPGIRSH